jgi:GNAT superfamily N-acetyltransferase
MAGDSTDPVTVRVASPSDRVAVSRVLDGALLEVDDLGDRLEAGEVLLAEDGGTAVGALVVAEAGPTERSLLADWPASAVHVRAIAVRRKRRRSGIGTALLERARDRWAPLVADFDADVAGFYADISVETRVDADGRHWALLREP